MKYLLIDGHPDEGRLSAALLDAYQAAIGESDTCERIAIRDLAFAPAATGYRSPQPWEPDLRRAAELLAECDHLAIAFPMWWGGEPAQVKAFVDRLLMPGFAYNQHDDDPWWDRHLVGRSADVIVTMDTPAIYLRLAYGNSIIKRWKKQVLGYCGFKPVRFHALGPVRQGGVEKNFVKWCRRMAQTAATARDLKRGARRDRPMRYLEALDR